MSDNNSRYNGWSSYETWLCSLWMDQDGDYWVEDVKNYKSVSSFAKNIEDFWYDHLHETLGTNGFLVDLLNSSLHKVDWQEIAEHIFPEENDEDDEDADEEDEEDETDE